MSVSNITNCIKDDYFYVIFLNIYTHSKKMSATLNLNPISVLSGTKKLPSGQTYATWVVGRDAYRRDVPTILEENIEVSGWVVTASLLHLEVPI